MEIQIIRHFGPSIAKTKIPQKIVDQLNSYIDQIVIDEQKSNKLNMGLDLAGDVTQEFKLEKEFMSNSGWLNFLATVTNEWIKTQTGEKITKFEMIESWVVRQFKNEYNPIHWHGGHISGAGFLKLPKTFGTHVQDKKDKNYVGGTLNFIHGSKQFMSNSKLKIIPEIGDFYFFPNYLMHTVYPFKGTDDERRSISFNANIDNKIYNTG
jgi:hypothetical protein